MAQSETNVSQWLEPTFSRSDASQAFIDQTEASPLPRGAEAAFIPSKLQILLTHPLSPSRKRWSKASWIVSPSQPARREWIRARGIDFGMFYDLTFSRASQTGTGLPVSAPYRSEMSLLLTESYLVDGNNMPTTTLGEESSSEFTPA